MKIATYNIWNSNKGFPKRLQQMIDEINRIDADRSEERRVWKEFIYGW